jgi:hypothetical protein
MTKNKHLHSHLAKIYAPVQITSMALTPSTMLPLGTMAPDFQLPDTNGKIVALADFKNAPALLVVFMCNHCPYVIHIRAGLAQCAYDYTAKHVAIVGINSNDVKNYPADSPAKMKGRSRNPPVTFSRIFTTRRRPSPKPIAPPARRTFSSSEKTRSSIAASSTPAARAMAFP